MNKTIIGALVGFFGGAYVFMESEKKKERQLADEFDRRMRHSAARQGEMFTYIINKLGPHAPAEVVKDVEDVLALNGITVEKESTDASS